jgi:DNA-binding NarL/FixJ family response regulator
MGSQTDIKILIADDHAIVREGFHALLEKIHGVAVVGQAQDGRQALDMIKKHQPDIVLMDIAMPELNGLQATTIIAKEHKKTKVIIVSMYANDEYVLQALRSGASGYLLKNARGAELEAAIMDVAKGSIYLTPSVSQTVAKYVADPTHEAPLERLTSRQREILQLVAEGYKTPQIALKLHISEKTVEKHRANLMRQLDIHDIPALVRFALRSGLIQIEE